MGGIYVNLALHKFLKGLRVEPEQGGRKTLTAKTNRFHKRLNNREKEIKGRGVRLAYERLQFAGLRLKSGLCWFKGEYFLFVDRYKTVPERIDLIESALQDLNELVARNALDYPYVLDEPIYPAAAEPANPDAPVTTVPETLA